VCEVLECGFAVSTHSILATDLFNGEGTMQRSAIWLALAGLILVAPAAVMAEEKANPTGTWKWSTTFNDQTRETTLKLKLDGDKLTGTISGRNNSENAIEEASFKDGEVAFSISRERDGQKFTMKYKAKVEGDTLKGKIESPGRDGQTRTRDFEAKRAKE